VALTYWIASAISFPDFSWAEFALYRPQGDNQVWPVVTALSHLNFGDPTDALKYGQGIGGFHAVILLPHALAYALFGIRGYMVADAALAWCCFVATVMLLRRFGLGGLASVVFGAAFNTGSLQAILQKLAMSVAKLLGIFKLGIAEWVFPDLISPMIGSRRVPRPFPTEIFFVLILYFLVRIWRQAQPPSFKQSLALGILMGILVQGDPYSFSAFGLLCLVVLARLVWLRRWKVPWRFVAGAIAGVALVGWYFVIQILNENPDSAVRFGLANYPRSKFFFLPGCGPYLRVLVIGYGAVLLHWVTVRRRRVMSSTDASLESNGTASAARAAIKAGIDTRFGLFALAMVVCGCLAQPIQVFLLGKGAQIYHYFLFTSPTFYSYALLLLCIRFFKLLSVPDAGEAPVWPWRITIAACAIALPVMFVLGIEEATDVMRNMSVSRNDITPWLRTGSSFRPALRGLERQFQKNPDFKDTRTFLTFCTEVNYLLTAFYDRRAFLPDNGFSTLSDRELEQRLFESAKICRFNRNDFAELIRDTYTLNFWLGCAKYWYASDHKFAPASDYAPTVSEAARALPPEAAFNLALPISEEKRLTAAYDEVLKKPSDLKTYPDLVILSLVSSIDESLYQLIYTNSVFRVYKKIPHGK
jgi:hypothetical protein